MPMRVDLLISFMDSPRPNHIAIPPPSVFSPPSSLSPSLFYTPPSSPDVFFTPFTSPILSSPPLNPPVSPPLTDLPFPSTELPIDLALDDGALSTLEKIYLFSRSKAIFHRIFIAHALPSYLNNVSPQDAIQYVLPLLSGLAMDDGKDFLLSFHSILSSLLQMNSSKKPWRLS